MNCEYTTKIHIASFSNETCLVWMVTHGSPKDIHFTKPVYSQVSPLLQWIISNACCRIAPSQNCYCHHKDLPQNTYLHYNTTEHPFNRFSTVCLYSFITVNCHTIRCHPEEDAFPFESGFNQGFFLKPSW